MLPIIHQRTQVDDSCKYPAARVLRQLVYLIFCFLIRGPILCDVTAQVRLYLRRSSRLHVPKVWADGRRPFPRHRQRDWPDRDAGRRLGGLSLGGEYSTRQLLKKVALKKLGLKIS